MKNTEKMYRFHLRRHDADGKPMSHGGVTLTVLFEEAEVRDNGILYNVVAGVAYCSVNDTYNKNKGVDIASGRMDRKPIYIQGFLWSDAMPPEQNIGNLLQTIIKNDKNKPTDRWWAKLRADGVSIHQKRKPKKDKEDTEGIVEEETA